MNRLLPVSASALEIIASTVCADATDIAVPLRDLWNPDLCPVKFLPYLAWARSVDRWDENWTEETKRRVVKAAFLTHKRKGTLGAVKRAIMPMGFELSATEWWETSDPPGTWRAIVDVMENGITEAMRLEVEALIDTVKPRSRHLIGLSIRLKTQATLYVGAVTYLGDELTIYPYFPELLEVGAAQTHTGAALHIIDTVSVTDER
ncbi:phage tail protein I [Serratia fonticola]|uniref:phage tail protein I n=1 Tax=Serratia fonticola TaxID=47917 RepID=UPI000BFE4317|nr:phage tail protein I [Serratia fonticola]ATM78975.1 phage tail protein I [Serratia fonticola]